MKIRTFKLFASVVGIYHIILGIAALVFPVATMGSTVKLFLGFSPTMTDQFVLVSKFTGVYVLAFGLMVSLIARDPEKYSVFITPVLVLFAIRLANKLIFFNQIGVELGVSTARNILAVVFVAVFFFGMLLTAPPRFWKARS